MPLGLWSRWSFTYKKDRFLEILVKTLNPKTPAPQLLAGRGLTDFLSGTR